MVTFPLKDLHVDGSPFFLVMKPEYNRITIVEPKISGYTTGKISYSFLNSLRGQALPLYRRYKLLPSFKDPGSMTIMLAWFLTNRLAWLITTRISYFDPKKLDLVRVTFTETKETAYRGLYGFNPNTEHFHVIPRENSLLIESLILESMGGSYGSRSRQLKNLRQLHVLTRDREESYYVGHGKRP